MVDTVTVSLILGIVNLIIHGIKICKDDATSCKIGLCFGCLSFNQTLEPTHVNIENTDPTNLEPVIMHKNSNTSQKNEENFPVSNSIELDKPRYSHDRVTQFHKYQSKDDNYKIVKKKQSNDSNNTI